MGVCDGAAGGYIDGRNASEGLLVYCLGVCAIAAGGYINSRNASEGWGV